MKYMSVNVWTYGYSFWDGKPRDLVNWWQLLEIYRNYYKFKGFEILLIGKKVLHYYKNDLKKNLLCLAFEKNEG
jgi:hypothetical protein